MGSSTTDTRFSIEERELRDSSMMFVFDKTLVKTVIARTPKIVDAWVKMQISEETVDFIGLNIERCPRSLKHGTNTPPSTLQLCTTRRFSTTSGKIDDENAYNCLIFQIKCYGNIPKSIINYLGNKRCVFMSNKLTWIKEKLHDCYNLEIVYPVDIRLYPNLYEVEIPPMPGVVGMSIWDEIFLIPDQVKYACWDAFIIHNKASSLIKEGKSRCMEVQVLRDDFSLDEMTNYLFGKAAESLNRTWVIAENNNETF